MIVTFNFTPETDGHGNLTGDGRLRMTINDFHGNRLEYNSCFRLIKEFIEQLPRVSNEPIILKPKK